MTEKQMKLRRLGVEASYLAACALHGTSPQVSKDLDLDELYRFCKFHTITSIVAMALEEAWKHTPADQEIMKTWRQARDKAIRKNILLNAERERILAQLESIGCWYMPLKGSLMQFEYPRFGMRQMSDNDILIDESKCQEVRDFMIADGYEVVAYLRANHDEYQKKPVYNMEMHRSLFSHFSDPEMAAYYRNVKDKLLPVAGKQFGFCFTDEDFYVYMLIHAHKHYIHGGVGIRNLMDVFVFHQNHGETMDWAYIERELRGLGAWDFDVLCRSLSVKLFAEPRPACDMSVEDMDLLDAFFSEGTYGTAWTAAEKRMKSMEQKNAEHGKMHYILSRIFPSAAYMEEMHPDIGKKWWLAPFYYLKRVFAALTTRRMYVIYELKNLLKRKK